MTEAKPGYPSEIVAAMGAEPTPEQWTAISAPLEPYVVVAGAGSGKTSVMAARVVYLALVALDRFPADHAGVLPGDVLCLTFTNKATENLALRVRLALASVELEEGEEPEVLNYHGFAQQVLERYGLMVGSEPDRRVLTNAQRTELCARVLDTVRFEHVTAEWQPTVIENILSLADQAANHRVTPEQIVEFNEERIRHLGRLKAGKTLTEAARQRIELARAVRAFQDLKQELGVIDFGDQIAKALEVAERVPDVGSEYRTRFSAVVLDEYQDTNVAQADLMAALFGGGFPVTAVGDPDQNIYAWRGASLFNLLQFPDRFRKADGSPANKLPLYTNFRSGRRILAAADHIIAPLPEEQRPDPSKRLVPDPANGEGEVELARYADEWEEAAAVAGRVVAIHKAGEKWSSVAVLCRKSRLFVPLQEAFRERHIPVEIVGLAGLMNLPEVVEVLAYARAVADPWASVALARILLGPRYRVGFKDLARVAAWAKERNYELRAREDEDEATAFLFAEALEHLDGVENLSEEGEARLEEFRAELASLRAEARRPVGEFLAELIRRIGLLTELDPSPDVEVARATQRNLAAFLDEVHAFAPVEGELTLRAFLDYVGTVVASDRPEWSPVQPSEEDSVKVMTVHQAKGLEFDNVFVPGVAKGLLPDVSIQQNPAERGRSLDFDLRGDREILPKFRDNLAAFKKALQDQELIEERRTCYVALTRARHRLFVSGAHWYGEGGKPKEHSAFFDELADWAEDTGDAVVDRGPDVGEENPLVGYRERFVRPWPPPAVRPEADGLFPNGWRRAASEAEASGVVQPALVEALGTDDAAAYRSEAEVRRTLAAHLAEREGEAPAWRPPVPGTLSASGLIDYSVCPKRFYWTAVQPLPRFSGPSARIGTQIHRWIEVRSRGQTSLLEADDDFDLTSEDLAGRPGRIETLQQAFLNSRFAGRTPLFAEREFLLFVEGRSIRGRIDAIYGEPDGRWEVVDYKTGKSRASRLQLDIYALACMEVWGKEPEDLTLTYLYLDPGEEVSFAVDDIDEIRAEVAECLQGIAGERFAPLPGPQCRYCDFLSFCPQGTAFVDKA